MEFRASHKVIAEFGLVLQYLEGNVTFDTLRSFRELVKSDPLYNSSYNRLNDIRKVKFIATSEEINEYSNAENRSKQHKAPQIVLITETPDQVASSILYNVYSRKGTVVQIVSTLSKACTFLSIGMERYNFIQKNLEQLAQSKELVAS